MKIKPKFLGSNLALIAGILLLLAGISQASSLFMGGVFTILGVLAYQSAKKRRLGINSTSTMRVTLEYSALTLIVLLTFLTDKNQLINDPFPNLVIPIWTIISYLSITRSSKEPTSERL